VAVTVRVSVLITLMVALVFFMTSKRGEHHSEAKDRQGRNGAATRGTGAVPTKRYASRD
jgi:hypothetical protein